jgi:hypothetical protein
MSYVQTVAGRYLCTSPPCFEDRVLLGSKARWRLSCLCSCTRCTVLIELKCAFWCLTCKLKSRTSRQERWKRGQGSEGNFGTSSALGMHYVVILFSMSCALAVSSVLMYVCACVRVCVCVCVCVCVVSDVARTRGFEINLFARLFRKRLRCALKVVEREGSYFCSPGIRWS